MESKIPMYILITFIFLIILTITGFLIFALFNREGIKISEEELVSGKLIVLEEKQSAKISFGGENYIMVIKEIKNNSLNFTLVDIPYRLIRGNSIVFDLDGDGELDIFIKYLSSNEEGASLGIKQYISPSDLVSNDDFEIDINETNQTTNVTITNETTTNQTTNETIIVNQTTNETITNETIIVNQTTNETITNETITNETITNQTTNETNQTIYIPTLDFSFFGVKDTVSNILFSPSTDAPTSYSLLWNFRDGIITQTSGIENVNHQYLQPGNYVISLTLKNSSTENILTVSKIITIEHPNYWPRIMPTYYRAGFNHNEIDNTLNSPGNVKVIMVAAFDLYKIWNGEINQSLIDKAHEKGMLIYVDVSQYWGDSDNFDWNNWNDIRTLFIDLTNAGIDGISFDEFGNINPILFNQLKSDLQEINPNIRIVVTEVFYSTVQSFIQNGGQPDYILLSWYLVGGANFQDMQVLAQQNNMRFGYWVDYSTYSYIQQIYNDADTVILWNYCWNSGTCGSDYSSGTWVPWSDSKTYVENLGNGLE